MKRITLAAVVALCIFAALAVSTCATTLTKTIYAKSLNTQTCGEEWHWVITDVNPVPAPAYVDVTFSESSVRVPLWKVTGNVAHYADTTHPAPDAVLETKAEIRSDWDGQFNLSHRRCGNPSPTSTPVATATRAATSTPRSTPTNTPTAPTATPTKPAVSPTVTANPSASPTRVHSTATPSVTELPKTGELAPDIGECLVPLLLGFGLLFLGLKFLGKGR